ncbi:MAG: biotin-dependent carboxyltransferase family protein, partial [Actinomycetes bacterium]
GTGRRGVRSYLAVRGGVQVTEVLGSRSTDVLSGLGPPPVAAGQTLTVGEPPATQPDVDVAPVAEVGSAEATLRIVPGPRDDWFTPSALETLLDYPYEVTPDSNRVAMKLSGRRLDRRGADELPSEGVVRGALQVPPSGQPVLFLADHPVTGGYPVIAVVVDADTDVAAQVRPGGSLRFARADQGAP